MMNQNFIKTLLGIILFLTFSLILKAQDTIIKKNGQNMVVEIAENVVNKIKYKTIPNNDGVIYEMSLNDIFIIKYNDGTLYYFNQDNPNRVTDNAGDIIIKTNYDEINTNVLEISTTEIKYKKLNNINGPLYTIFKSEVMAIIYKNGSMEFFNNINHIDSTNIVTSENEIIQTDKKELLKGKKEFNNINEIGIVFNDFSSFGLVYKTGIEKRIFNINLMAIHAVESTNGYDSISPNDQDIGFSLSFGIERLITLNKRVKFCFGPQFKVEYLYTDYHDANYLYNITNSYIFSFGYSFGIKYKINEYISILAQFIPGVFYEEQDNKYKIRSIPNSSEIKFNNVTQGYDFDSSDAYITISFNLNKL